MIFFWLGFALIILFGFVVLFGAPYLPTLAAQQKTALDLLDLKKGQTFYDLGCGDGRLLKTAAKRGLKCVGYELNPILAIYAYLHTWKYRSQVKIVCGNFWSADLTGADGIFVFLLDRYMQRLDDFVSVQHNQKKLKLVSYSFPIPGKKPIRKSGPIYLYKY